VAFARVANPVKPASYDMKKYELSNFDIKRLNNDLINRLKSLYAVTYGDKKKEKRTK
jgi:hypothetical protein